MVLSLYNELLMPDEPFVPYPRPPAPVEQPSHAQRMARSVGLGGMAIIGWNLFALGISQVWAQIGQFAHPTYIVEEGVVLAVALALLAFVTTNSAKWVGWFSGVIVLITGINGMKQVGYPEVQVISSALVVAGLGLAWYAGGRSHANGRTLE